MDGLTDERIKGRADRRTNERIKGLADRRTNGRINGLADRRTDGLMDRLTDRRTNGRTTAADISPSARKLDQTRNISSCKLFVAFYSRSYHLSPTHRPGNRPTALIPF